MKPKRIILVRHAQSVGNIDKTHYEHTPDYQIPLTDKGHEQARSAGHEISSLIKNESIYAYISPWLRSRETYADIKNSINNNIIRSIEDPRLREQDWGHYKNISDLLSENRERKSYGKFYYRLEDGESGADVFDRVSTFLETLHRDFSKPDYPENALIVTHGVTLKIFLMRWFHWTVEEWETFQNPKNAQIMVMHLQDNDRYELI